MGYTHDCEKKRQHVQTLLAAAERGFQITKFQFWAARFEITGFRSQNDGWAKAKIDSDSVIRHYTAFRYNNRSCWSSWVSSVKSAPANETTPSGNCKMMVKCRDIFLILQKGFVLIQNL
jgi:hypothetical protein